jgi:2-polyprenyl-6-methoxyphenol hydroxylase-like FAD-dependent oxidoreductase
MSSPIALIVGAGIGGLAAAVALRRAGWRVRIFERAASPRELGFALILAPNAMAALRELGLDERLIAEGHIVREAEMRTLAGRALRRIDVSTAGHAAAARASLGAAYWYISLLTRDLPGEILDPVARANRLAARLDARYQAIVQNTKAEDIRFDELLDRDPIGNCVAMNG